MSNKSMVKVSFDDITDFDHILRAYRHCRKGKKKRHEVIQYDNNVMTRLIDLQQRLKSDKYKIGNLYSFVIYEPKRREITANRFEDKIVQRLLCKYVLEPLIAPVLIYDNYASQENKGTDLGLRRLEHFMMDYKSKYGTDGYVGVFDIKGYFKNINRGVMWSQIKRLPMDKQCKRLMKQQIFIDDDNTGICIGFQTSQWMAVYHLNEMDHFIKEKLHIKYYARYMDDFYIIHPDKEYVKYCMKQIREYLAGIGLSLNSKTQIHKLSEGIKFLGFHAYYTNNSNEITVKIKKDSIKRMKRRDRKFTKRIEAAELDSTKEMLTRTAEASYRSWRAHACHSDDKTFVNKMDNWFYSNHKSVLTEPKKDNLFKEEPKPVSYRNNLNYMISHSMRQPIKPKKLSKKTRKKLKAKLNKDPYERDENGFIVLRHKST